MKHNDVQNHYRYKETAPYEKGFAEYYQEHIVPLSQAYEPQRKSYKRFLLLGILNIFSVLIISLAVLFLYAEWVGYVDPETGELAILIPIWAYFFFKYRRRLRFFATAKEKIIPKILAYYGEYRYRSEIRLLKNYYTPHDLIMADGDKGQKDFIWFEKNDFIFSCIEQIAEGEANKLFISVEMPFNDGDDFLIRNQGVKYSLIGAEKPDSLGYCWGTKRLRKLRNLKTDIEKFDKECVLFSNDKCREKANMLLADSFIDYIIRLNTLFEKEGFFFSIKGESVLISLSSGQDLFEIGENYDEPVANAAATKKFLKEFHCVKAIAEELVEYMIEYHNNLNKETPEVVTV